ncbi:hypothetical protein HK098_005019 [Nowakowskiella sp. JEL0407]|nr:hypothetical protein HK098_005019 [Nowakowskiella sp. JEL0407]
MNSNFSAPPLPSPSIMELDASDPMNLLAAAADVLSSDEKNATSIPVKFKHIPEPLSLRAARQLTTLAIPQDSNSKLKESKKQFTCTFEGCDAKFARLFNMKQHLKGHSGLKPFKCDYPNCTKDFRRKQYLTRHLLQHNDTEEARKPHFCDHSEIIMTSDGRPELLYCHARFARMFNLKEHVKLHVMGTITDKQKDRFYRRSPPKEFEGALLGIKMAVDRFQAQTVNPSWNGWKIGEDAYNEEEEEEGEDDTFEVDKPVSLTPPLSQERKN